MKCLKCGAELQETDLFCPKCGEPVKRETNNENKENSENNEGMFTYERQEENTQPNNVNTNNTKNTNSSQQNQTNNGGQAPKKKTNTGLIFVIVLILVIALVAGIAYFVRSRIKEAAQNEFLSSLFGKDNNGNANVDEDTLKDWIYGNGNEINGTGNPILDSLMGEDGNAILNAIFGGSNSTSTNSTVNNTTSDSKLNTTSKNTTSTTPNVNTTQVDFGGYRFYVPKNYTPDVLNDSTLKIQSTEENWVASFGVGSQNVADLMGNSDLMRTMAEQTLKKQGMDIQNSTTKTIDGVKYVIFEAKSGGESVDFAFIDKGDGNTLYMVLVASDLNEALNSVSTLVKDAQYIG